jgi:hypothetical protein
MQFMNGVDRDFIKPIALFEVFASSASTSIASALGVNFGLQGENIPQGRAAMLPRRVLFRCGFVPWTDPRPVAAPSVTAGRVRPWSTVFGQPCAPHIEAQ